jgi:HAMP domain-containing protein
VNKFVHTIRFKIIVSLGACVAVNIAVGLSGANGLARLNSNMSDTFSTAVLPIAQLSDVRAAELDIRAKLRRMQVARSPENVAKNATSVEADLAIIDKQWSTYYPAGVSGDKERAVADQIASGLKDFQAQTNEAVSDFKAGNFDAAGDVINRSADAADAVAGLLRDDSQINVEEAKQYSDDGESLYRTLLSIAIVLVGIGLVVAIGVSVYLLRVILRPLRKAIDAANHIADGQLDNRIESDSRGEFGELLDALGKMDRNLSNTVRNQDVNRIGQRGGARNSERQHRSFFAHGRTGGVARRNGGEHDAVDRNGKAERGQCTPGEHLGNPGHGHGRYRQRLCADNGRHHRPDQQQFDQDLRDYRSH